MRETMSGLTPLLLSSGKVLLKMLLVFEHLMKPNEMKAEITQLNGKAAAVLSGSHSCTDQEYEQEEESSRSSRIPNPIHFQCPHFQSNFHKQRRERPVGRGPHTF